MDVEPEIGRNLFMVVDLDGIGILAETNGAFGGVCHCNIVHMTNVGAAQLFDGGDGAFNSGVNDILEGGNVAGLAKIVGLQNLVLAVEKIVPLLSSCR